MTSKPLPDHMKLRREQMQQRTDAELEAIASMECIVPLDHQLADMADAELRSRHEDPPSAVLPEGLTP